MRLPFEDEGRRSLGWDMAEEVEVEVEKGLASRRGISPNDEVVLKVFDLLENQFAGFQGRAGRRKSSL
jgi:hypothetical protein